MGRIDSGLDGPLSVCVCKNSRPRVPMASLQAVEAAQTSVRVNAYMCECVCECVRVNAV